MKRIHARVAAATAVVMLCATLTGAGQPEPDAIVEHDHAETVEAQVPYDEELGLRVLPPGSASTRVAQGSVSRAGKPIAGAEIQALEVLEGDSTELETVLLGVTYSKGDGSYQLDIPTSATTPSAGSAATGSYRNIELVVLSGDYLDVRHVTLFSGPESDGPAFSTSAYDIGVGESVRADGPAGVDFTLGESEAVGRDGTFGPAKTKRTIVSTSYPWVVVGTFFSTYSGNKASFTTTSGATSELGIGYSVSGSKGSWKQTSTKTTSATSVTDWTSENGKRSRGYQQQWRYNKVRIQYCSIKEGYCYKTVYQFEPSGPTAGGKYYTPSVPTANNCSPRSGTATWSASSQRAVNWSNGVDLNTVIGINLSSRTGYTGSTKITLKSGTGAHRACGTHAKPQAGVYFGQLVVKPTA